MTAEVRADAARVLHQVAFRGRSLDRTLLPLARGHPDAAFLSELAYGATRHFFSLREQVERRLRRPPRPGDEDLLCLLIVGAYQLVHLRTPPYAAVSETVSATRLLNKAWASGLANAVLRHLGNEPPRSVEGRFDHPRWLIDLIQEHYGAASADILAANNSRAPMALRINCRRVAVADYRAKLDAAGIGHRAGIGIGTVILEAPVALASLPGYAAGEVSAQDEGAQLAAPVLGACPGDRVLDACAAPGGKAAHLVERAPGLRVLALDADAGRLEVLEAERRRLGATDIEPRVGDATALDWWDGEPFEKILIDAPCSGTGTLRRHPDIKLTKKPSDIGPLAAIQRTLVANLWRTLAPGGTMLYCTCSILPAENDVVVRTLLERSADARVSPIDAAWGHATRHGRQLLPAPGGPDGFYFARLTRARR